jgi:hypothetical protein
MFSRQLLWKLSSSTMWRHVVWQIRVFIDISEQSTDPIFSAEVKIFLWNVAKYRLF